MIDCFCDYCDILKYGLLLMRLNLGASFTFKMHGYHSFSMISTIFNVKYDFKKINVNFVNFTMIFVSTVFLEVGFGGSSRLIIALGGSLMNPEDPLKPTSRTGSDTYQS